MAPKSSKLGPASADAQTLLRPSDHPDTFTIRDGFHFAFTSCFNMDDWKPYLRGKIPMGELQPVQMCSSLKQVGEVMKSGLPKGANLDQRRNRMESPPGGETDQIRTRGAVGLDLEGVEARFPGT